MVNARRFLPHTGLFLVLVCGTPFAAAKGSFHVTQTWPARLGTPLSVNAVFEVAEIGGVAIEPDGRRVAFSTASTDPGCNCYHVRLNLMDLSSGRIRVVSDLGQPFPTTYPDGTVNGWPIVAEPLWSADGRFLAYLVNESGRGVLFVYDSDTHVSKKLVLGTDEPFGFTWGESPEVLIYQTGGATSKALEMLQNGQREGYRYGSAFRVNPDAATPTIARVPANTNFPDDSGLVFKPGRAWSELKEVSVRGGSIRPASSRERIFALHAEFSYLEGPPQRATMVRSTSGRYALALGKVDIGYAGSPITLTINKGGETVSVHKTSADICPGEHRRRGVAAAYWDELDQDFIGMCTKSADEGPGEEIHVVLIDPSVGTVKRSVTIGGATPEGDFGRRCDVNGRDMICEEEGPSEPPALFKIDLLKRTSQVLYDPNRALREQRYPKVEKIAWKNRDGADNWAHLVYPLQYNPHKRYPLIITRYTDGGFLRGNTGDENPIFGYAKAGFFVLSSGRIGAAYPRNKTRGMSELQRWKSASWHFRDFQRIQDALDSITQYLVHQGLVDEGRVARTGLSHGSNEIDYALANGKRIAAAITSTCCWTPSWWVVNPLVDPRFYDLFGLENPETDRDLSEWALISPTMHVDEIHTAILANVAQYERLGGFMPLWALMRGQHKPMEAYIYSGEHHIKFQPAHLAAVQHRNIDWLRFWLQGYVDPNPKKAARYARWEQMCEEWSRHDPRAVRVPNNCGTASRTL